MSDMLFSDLALKPGIGYWATVSTTIVPGRPSVQHAVFLEQKEMPAVHLSGAQGQFDHVQKLTEKSEHWFPIAVLPCEGKDGEKTKKSNIAEESGRMCDELPEQEP